MIVLGLVKRGKETKFPSKGAMVNKFTFELTIVKRRCMNKIVVITNRRSMLQSWRSSATRLRLIPKGIKSMSFMLKLVIGTKVDLPASDRIL